MGDPRWSSLFLKDCSPWEGPTLGQFMKSCSPWEGLMLEQFLEDCLHGRDPTLEQKSARSPSAEEEGAAETTCDELTVTPIPHPPVLLGGRR